MIYSVVALEDGLYYLSRRDSPNSNNTITKLFDENDDYGKIIWFNWYYFIEGVLVTAAYTERDTMIITVSEEDIGRLDIHMLSNVLPPAIPGAFKIYDKSVFEPGEDLDILEGSRILHFIINVYYDDVVFDIKLDNGTKHTEVKSYRLVDYVMIDKHKYPSLAKVLKNRQFVYVNDMADTMASRIFLRLLTDNKTYSVGHVPYVQLHNTGNSSTRDVLLGADYLGYTRSPAIILDSDGVLSQNNEKYDDVVKFSYNVSNKQPIYLRNNHVLYMGNSEMPNIRDQGKIGNFYYHDLTGDLMVLYNDGSLDLYSLVSMRHKSLFGPHQHRIRFASTTSLDKEINTRIAGVRTKSSMKRV